MKFDRLVIENFLRFKKAELPLSDLGLVLIEGEERDSSKSSSNGAGKSSLLDALCWCLWGQTVRGLKHDEVVNHTVNKDCRVVVSFRDQGVTYTVERRRKFTGEGKPNDLIFLIDEETAESSDMASTQKLINKVLGLNFTTFQAMMPGSGIRVADLTDAKIKELLEKLLQTESMSKAQSFAKEELKNKKFLISRNYVELERLESLRNQCEKDIANYRELQDSFSRKKLEKISNLEDEIDNWQREKYSLRTDFDKKDLAEQQIQEFDSKIKSKEIELDQVLKEKSNDVSSVERLINEFQKNIISNKASLHHIKDDKDELKRLEGRCFTCKQRIDETHKLVHLDKCREAIFKLERAITYYKDYIEHQQKDLEDILTKYDNKLKNIRKELDLFKTKRQESQNSLNKFESAQRAIKNVDITIESLQKKVIQAENETNPYEGLIASQIEKNSELTTEWLQLSSETHDLEEEITDLEFWVHGFSPKGLRNYMLKHITPVLNQKAEEYSNILTDGELSVRFETKKKLKKGKSSDEFNIVVRHKNGGQSYTSLSSGETSRADLIIAFALGDLAQQRANKSIPFRFLDEPFENVDEVGHEAILALLTNQSKYNTVFCITHKPSFQQLFPTRVTVVKENGESRLEWR